MRQGLSALLSFSLFFSSTLLGLPLQAAPKSHRLEDHFLKSANEFSQLSEKERANYLVYLYTLNVIIETELSGDLVLLTDDSAKKTSKFEVLRQLLGPLFSVEESQAFLPVLVPVAEALVVNGTRMAASRALSTAASRAVIGRAAEKFMGNAEIVEKLADGTVKAAKSSGVLSKFWSAAKVASGPALAALGWDELATMEAAVMEDKPAAAPAAQTVTETAPPAAEPDPAPAEPQPRTRSKGSKKNYRKVGKFCLFGGHASAYKKAEGHFYCPAPAGTVNNPICKGSGPAPTFLCQSMGLSENGKSAEVTKKLCVPLRGKVGLTDLTVRCSKAYINDFLPSVKAVDPEKLIEFQKQVEEGLKAVESKRGVEDVGLLQYCESQNSINKKIQAGPCEALISMMDATRKELPKPVAAAAVPPAAAPAAPAKPDAKSGTTK